MGNFKIDNEFWTFKIYTKEAWGDWEQFVTYGDMGTCIELRRNASTCCILDIECIYMDNVHSEEIFRRPDIRACLEWLELREYDKAACFYNGDTKRRIPCIINVLRDEMALIFSPSDAEFYHIDGRVEYYYDEKFQLAYIKVVDLTEKEYNFLKSAGANGEYPH